jgi:hypothetical protein
MSDLLATQMVPLVFSMGGVLMIIMTEVVGVRYTGVCLLIMVRTHLMFSIAAPFGSLTAEVSSVRVLHRVSTCKSVGRPVSSPRLDTRRRLLLR